MVLGIIFCLSALMCVAVAVLCAALVYEVWNYNFMSGAVCFFYGTAELSMLTFGVDALKLRRRQGQGAVIDSPLQLGGCVVARHYCFSFSLLLI